MVAQPVRWFDDEPDVSPWLKALEWKTRVEKRPGKGGATSMSRRSLWRSTSTPKLLRETGSIF
jgi:hypothetical protein